MRKITIQDALNYGYCVKGTLSWLASNGITKKDFVKNGITEDQVKQINDCMLNKLFEHKYAQQQKAKDR